MDPVDLTDIQRAALLEGPIDYVGLWRFVWRVRRRTPAIAAEALRDEVLREVQGLLEARLIEAGRLTRNGGFTPWTEGPAESLRRISREWQALGHEPDIQDICWFRNTASGNAVAHDLSAAPRRGPGTG